MTPLVAAASAGAATYGGWILARRAADRRNVAIGGFPHAAAGLCAGVAVTADMHSGCTPAMVAAIAGVTVAAIVDIRTGFIFDTVTFALSAVALLLSVGRGSLSVALAGAVTVGAALSLLYVTTARRGLGLGDVKLGVGIGAALGIQLGLFALATAFVIGGAYGVWLLATRRAALGAAIGFGPFIATGTYLAVVLPNSVR